MADSPPSRLYFYEVWEDQNGNLQMRNGTLPYDKVEDWLDMKADYVIPHDRHMESPGTSMLLRLVSCDIVRHPFALGCGRGPFEQIRRAFKLHRTSEEAILNNNGAFARYFTVCRESGRLNKLDLVFKVPNYVNTGYDALSLSFDANKQTTRAFLHGWLDDDYHRLLHYLQGQKDASFFLHPLLLPTELLQSHQRRTESYRIEIDENVYQTEFQIGYAIPGRLTDKSPRKSKSSLAPDKLDFGKIVRRLHSCQTELSALIYVGKFGKELGEFLRKTIEELQESSFATPDQAYFEELVHQVDFSTNLYATLVSNAFGILKERVQSHINLTFSLIAQDENKISRSVAEESTMIAVASKRDSTAMKTIALLTVVFLPPTFVATFFSMTMFDWIPEQPGGRITSKYFWIYWAVAVPLTALVLIIWRVWLNMEERRYQRDMRKAKQEKADGFLREIKIP